jgi:hypothetical protein
LVDFFKSNLGFAEIQVLPIFVGRKRIWNVEQTRTSRASSVVRILKKIGVDKLIRRQQIPETFATSNNFFFRFVVFGFDKLLKCRPIFVKRWSTVKKTSFINIVFYVRHFCQKSQMNQLDFIEGSTSVAVVTRRYTTFSMWRHTSFFVWSHTSFVRRRLVRRNVKLNYRRRKTKLAAGRSSSLVKLWRRYRRRRKDVV